MLNSRKKFFIPVKVKICLTAVKFKLVLRVELFKVIQEFASEA